MFAFEIRKRGHHTFNKTINKISTIFSDASERDTSFQSFFSSLNYGCDIKMKTDLICKCQED